MSGIFDLDQAKKILGKIENADVLDESPKSLRIQLRNSKGGRREIDLRKRESGVTVYANQLSQSGSHYSDLQIEGVVVMERYPKTSAGAKNPGFAGRAANLPSLNPRHNEVMRIRISNAVAFRQFIGWYIDDHVSAPTVDDQDWVASELDKIVKRLGRNVTSPEDLVRLLERRTEIGRAGEQVAVADELRRLRNEDRCPEPEKYLEHIALIDVGTGYDIRSFWPGNERCIEVKSSTRGSSEFFISVNEKEVLAALGSKSWIYLVEMAPDGTGEVTKRIQDPIRKIPKDNFHPVSWRVKVA